MMTGDQSDTWALMPPVDLALACRDAAAVMIIMRETNLSIA
jgi:hypothetical protein